MKYNRFLDNVTRKAGIPSDPAKRRLHMCERTVPFKGDLFEQFKSSLTQEDFTNYPDGYDDLKEKLSNYNFVKNPKRIFIGAGADGVLSTIFRAFVSPGSKVLMPEAHFPMYDVYLQQNQGIKEVLRYEFVNGELKLNTQVDESILKDLSLIVIGHPNSPVGDCLTSKEIEKLSSYGVPLVVDEVYSDFGKLPYDDLVFYQENVISVKSFSKSWGAAGCRVGYAIASEKVVELLDKLRPMFDIPTVSKKFAMFLLENSQELNIYVEQVIQERMILTKVFKWTQFGNWVHIPVELDAVDYDNWEVKRNVKLPLSDQLFDRVTIFPGISEHIFARIEQKVRTNPKSV